MRAERLVFAAVHAFLRVDDLFPLFLGIHAENTRPSELVASTNPASAPMEVAVWTGSEHVDMLRLTGRGHEFGVGRGG